MGPKEQAALRRAMPAARLVAQRIAGPGARTPREVVKWLGALQAQDYAGTKWALGLRLGRAAATETAIERALAEGDILRTHLMRWTWQLVLPEDVRWMLDLVRDRLVARAMRRHRQLELDDATFRKSNGVLERALRDGDHLTRDELALRLQKSGISPAGERLSHLLGRAELDAVVCTGARRGKQFTYTHLDHRAPARRAPWQRDDAIAELARRYYQSRGPATLADFVWWSGLTAPEARAGTSAVRSSLIAEAIDGQTYFWVEEASKKAKKISPLRAGGSSRCYLLPSFDEYLVAYRGRDAVLDPRQARRLNAGGGILPPAILFDGRVIGTWRREITKAGIAVELDLFEASGRSALPSIERAAQRFGRFLGAAAEISRIRVGGTRGAPRPSPLSKATSRSATQKAPVRPQRTTKNRERPLEAGVKRNDGRRRTRNS
jgi:hypothetical protein